MQHLLHCLSIKSMTPAPMKVFKYIFICIYLCVYTTPSCRERSEASQWESVGFSPSTMLNLGMELRSGLVPRPFTHRTISPDPSWNLLVRTKRHMCALWYAEEKSVPARKEWEKLQFAVEWSGNSFRPEDGKGVHLEKRTAIIKALRTELGLWEEQCVCSI